MRCNHVDDQGRQCPLNALAGYDLCFFHDNRPETVQKRHEAQSRGGRGRRRKRTVVFDVKFNLKDRQQIPLVLDEALDLTLRKMLDREECELVRKMCESARKALQDLSVDRKMDELLRMLNAEKSRPVDPADAEELLHFAQDDADEIAQSIADSDDAGQHDGAVRDSDAEAARHNADPDGRHTGLSNGDHDVPNNVEEQNDKPKR